MNPPSSSPAGTLAALLASRKHLFLAFDGPVCRLFAARTTMGSTPASRPATLGLFVGRRGPRSDPGGTNIAYVGIRPGLVIRCVVLTGWARWSGASRHT